MSSFVNCTMILASVLCEVAYLTDRVFICHLRSGLFCDGSTLYSIRRIREETSNSEGAETTSKQVISSFYDFHPWWSVEAEVIQGYII